MLPPPGASRDTLIGLGPMPSSAQGRMVGRVSETQELFTKASSNMFRAGLLFGPHGVGKSSLLRAGLVPALKSEGAYVHLCERPMQPIASVSEALARMTGYHSEDNESAINYCARVVSETPDDNKFVFIFDEIEDALRDENSPVIGELAELFSRLVSRSSGRARFVFACDAKDVHLLSHLEAHTGSLFPPSNRLELKRLHAESASNALATVLHSVGGSVEPALVSDLVGLIAKDGEVLPADLQIAAMAVRHLGVHNHEQLAGTATLAELGRRWIRSVSSAFREPELSRRVLITLLPENQPEISARRVEHELAVSPERLQVVVGDLATAGLINVETHANAEPMLALAHPRLATSVREATLVERVAVQRADEIYGGRKRLSPLALLRTKLQGIKPQRPEHVATLRRTKRLVYAGLGGIVGVFVLLTVIAWISLSGSYYLASDGRGDEARVVVRAGNPTWSGFNWLPGNYGDKVADTGWSQSMLAPKSWSRVHAQSIRGDLDGDYAGVALLRPELQAVITYVTDPEDGLKAIQGASSSNTELAAMLDRLRHVARDDEQDLALIRSAIAHESELVRAAAHRVLEARAGFGSSAYKGLLLERLGGVNAAGAIALLPPDQRAAAVNGAIVSAATADKQRALVRVLAAKGYGLTVAAAIALLRQSDAENTPSTDVDELQRLALDTLARDLAQEKPALTGAALAELLDGTTSARARKATFRLLIDTAPAAIPGGIYDDVKRVVQDALSDADDEVRALAIEAHAKFDPEDAKNRLVLLKSTAESLQVAKARGWGRVAFHSKEKATRLAAQGVLEEMLKTTTGAMRRAAAVAYGFTGGISRGELYKLVKNGDAAMAAAAMQGLVNSARKASGSGASSGIYERWRRKGSARKAATLAYARLAAIKPASAMNYLVQTLASKDDARAHSVAVDGICAAYRAGNKRARSELAKLAKRDEIRFRRRAIQCIRGHEGVNRATAIAIASGLADTGGRELRVVSAQILVTLANDEALPASAPRGRKNRLAYYRNKRARDRLRNALVKLAGDKVSEIRGLALAGVKKFGSDLPTSVLASLKKPALARRGVDERHTLVEIFRNLEAKDELKARMDDDDISVRARAFVALAAGGDGEAYVGKLLAAPNPRDRQRALELLTAFSPSSGNEGAPGMVEVFTAAARDGADSVRLAALRGLARVGVPAQVVPKFREALTGTRSEQRIAGIILAAQPLAARSPTQVIELLQAMESGAGHDVGKALLVALGRAYASAHSATELIAELRASNLRSLHRLVIATALCYRARLVDKADEVSGAIKDVGNAGPAPARLILRMVTRLIADNADAASFFGLLVP